MKIHWGRILIAALVAEALLVVLVNISRRLSLSGAISTIIGYLSFVALMFLAALWVARKIESRFILHGTLVGFAAVAFYVILTFNATLRGQVQINVEYFLLHIIKILGGAAGGFVAGRWKSPERQFKQQV